jgi:plasmid maintenance system antidote protein VapI
MSTLLKALEQNSGLKSMDVAERINMSQKEYKSILSGEKMITIDLAKKFGEVFNIAPELFLQDESRVSHYNTGANSHSNMVYGASTYIDIQTIPEKLFEKILRERDKMKDELSALKLKH